MKILARLVAIMTTLTLSLAPAAMATEECRDPSVSGNVTLDPDGVTVNAEVDPGRMCAE